MVYKLGDEFKSIATPSPELLRKLLYYANIDSGSVLTDGFKNPEAVGSERKSNAKADIDIAWLQLSESVQAHIESLQQRIGELDRASLLAMQEAQERLDMTQRAANRAKDGRRVYETEDGRTVFDEQGSEVTRDEIDWDTWNPDAGKWKDFTEALRQEQEAAAFYDRVQEQNVRLENNPSDEDLADIEDGLDALEAGMPASVARQYRPPGESEQTAAESDKSAMTRSTSAAKDYGTDPALSDGVMLRGPFTGAVSHTQTEPEDRPGVAPRPGADFTPT